MAVDATEKPRTYPAKVRGFSYVTGTHTAEYRLAPVSQTRPVRLSEQRRHDKAPTFEGWGFSRVDAYSVVYAGVVVRYVGP